MLKRRRERRMGMSVKAMIFCGKEILLLQKKDREGRHPWEFPGGGVQFGENMEMALRREVKEETGLDIQVISIAGLWSYQRSSHQFLTGAIFVAQAQTKEVQLSNEHLDFAWVRPEDMKRYPIHSSLYRALRHLKDYNGSKGHAAVQAFLEKWS